jgi:hypothetical protein
MQLVNDLNTTVAVFSGSSTGVDYIELIAGDAVTPPQVHSAGESTNVSLDITTQGSGTVTVYGGNETTGNGNGGGVSLLSGNGFGSGQGGTILVLSGTGGATGEGGGLFRQRRGSDDGGRDHGSGHDHGSGSDSGHVMLRGFVRENDGATVDRNRNRFISFQADD